jgi:YfiH family protein
VSIEWINADWPAPSNIHAGTTLRHGGVSLNAWASLNLGEHVNDDPASVAENRRRFLLGRQLPSEPKWLRQTHSCNVAIEAPPQLDSGTDAIVTRAIDSVCVVLTADCLPVVFTANNGDEIAVAHAGWRGLCNGILEATVNAMNADPTTILAWLGPAIGQSAFEVGVEVREQFIAQQGDAAAHFVENERGRFQADLYGLAKQRLGALGVQSVYGGNRCTHAEKDDFFSYRRDGECGRMATFIYRTESA